MTSIHHPLWQLPSLASDFDRLFRSLSAGLPAERVLRPVVNVWVEDSTVKVSAELPGVAADDVEIEVLGDELHLKGERRSDHEDGTRVHRAERFFGAFERVIRLPFEVESEGVEARLENGVLTVDLPRREKDGVRRIPVAGAQA